MAIEQSELKGLVPEGPVVDPVLDDVKLADILIHESWMLPSSDLVESMRVGGLISPVLLAQTKNADGWTVYRVLAGRRRVLAARKLEWKTISAAIRESGDLNADVVALQENLIRSSNPLGEYTHLRTLLDAGWTEAQIAKASNISVAQIQKLRRTGDRMTTEMMQAVEAKAIPWSAVVEIVAMPEKTQKRIMSRVVAGEKVTLKDIAEERTVLADDALNAMPEDMFGPSEPEKDVLIRRAMNAIDAMLEAIKPLEAGSNGWAQLGAQVRLKVKKVLPKEVEA